MPDVSVAEAIEKWGSVIITGAIVGIGTLIPQWLERRKAKTRVSALGRIEQKLDDYQAETRRSVELMQMHLAEVDTTATEALHHAIGPDGKNGNRGEIAKLEKRVNDIETWQENETMRERDRLQRIADAALPSPGIPTPRLS